MSMTESDTMVNLIDPKLYSSGWINNLISREYYFTDGRKLIGNILIFYHKITAIYIKLKR